MSAPEVWSWQHYHLYVSIGILRYVKHALHYSYAIRLLPLGYMCF